MTPERLIVDHPEPWTWLVSSWSAPFSPYVVTAELLENAKFWSFDADCPCQFYRPGKRCPHTFAVQRLFLNGPCCVTERCPHVPLRSARLKVEDEPWKMLTA